MPVSYLFEPTGIYLPFVFHENEIELMQLNMKQVAPCLHISFKGLAPVLGELVFLIPSREIFVRLLRCIADIWDHICLL